MLPDQPNFITLVSGVPRSGTSMMMQMLSAGGIPALTDDLRPADVNNPRGYFEYEKVKHLNKDAAWLSDAHGKAVKVIYKLLYKLPSQYRYRVLFMQRDLSETVASHRAMLEQLGNEGSKLNDEKLAQLLAVDLQHLYEWLSTRPNFRVLYVNYNRIFIEPEIILDEVTKFLGVQLNIEAMLNVIDPALYRQKRLS